MTLLFSIKANSISNLDTKSAQQIANLLHHGSQLRNNKLNIWIRWSLFKLINFFNLGQYFIKVFNDFIKLIFRHLLVNISFRFFYLSMFWNFNFKEFLKILRYCFGLNFVVWSFLRQKRKKFLRLWHQQTLTTASKKCG